MVRGIWNLDITGVDEAGRTVSAIGWEAEAFDENGEERKVEVVETGLGTYSAKVSSEGAERLALRLHDSTYGKLKTIQWTRDYPAEYRFNSKEAKELSEIPQMKPEEIRDGIEAVKVRTSAIPWFSSAAIAFLLASVVRRRP